MGKKTSKSFFAKATKGKDISSLFGSIQKIISAKPTINQMFEDVQMMKFKIKPIQGDVSAFDLKNERFIESIWSLGKLDEFFHKEFPQLSKKDKEIFLRIFDSLYIKYQRDLNHISLQPTKKMTKKSELLELEIYREGRLRKKIN